MFTKHWLVQTVWQCKVINKIYFFKKVFSPKPCPKRSYFKNQMNAFRQINSISFVLIIESCLYSKRHEKRSKTLPLIDFFLLLFYCIHFLIDLSKFDIIMTNQFNALCNAMQCISSSGQEVNNELKYNSIRCSTNGFVSPFKIFWQTFFSIHC